MIFLEKASPNHEPVLCICVFVSVTAAAVQEAMTEECARYGSLKNCIIGQQGESLGKVCRNKSSCTCCHLVANAPTEMSVFLLHKFGIQLQGRGTVGLAL